MSPSPAFTIPNFEVLELLGRGGMASVWKARQVSLDRHVAIKILSSTFASDPEDVRRFHEEARAAAQLKHPGIVEVYDASFADGFYYFVMELVDGYTMGELLRRKGRCEESDALIMAENVAAAMDYAWTHFQMVHCDIKPDNIMVDADGSVKITDLGLSRSVAAMKHGAEEEPDEILGTPAYMSPEQVYGSDRLDCRSDIYELGATLYHLVTGRMLFHGKTDEEMLHCHVEGDQALDPRRFSPGWVSDDLAILLEKMLAKDPRHRPLNWKWILTDLNNMHNGYSLTPVHLPPSGSSMARDT